MSHPTACLCPHCGSALALTAVSPPADQKERYRTIRDAAEATGQPPGRLRRWVREGLLPAREGARGAHLVRVADVDRLLADLPPIARDSHLDDVEAEIARLDSAS